MITTPENLSKDRLKTELKKKGIKFNNNENKLYYVDLYRNKIMTVEPVTVHVRSEFSSDDEIRQSPKVTKKPASTAARRKSGKQGHDYSLPLVQKLTDKELRSELIQFGEDPGPINMSTRSVYQRQLSRLMEEEKDYLHDRSVPSLKKRASPEAVNDSFIGEWSDEEEESDEEEVDEEVDSSRSYNLRKRRGSPLRTREPMPKPTPQLPHTSQTVPRATVSRSPASPRVSPLRSRGRRPRESEPCRIMWSCFLLLLVFAAAFLLYEHLTVPDGKNSLLVCGYNSACETVLGLVSPLMMKQEVEHTTTTTSEPVATPPPRRNRPPPPKEKTPPPPKEKTTHPPKEETTHPPKEETSHPPKEETVHPPREEMPHPPKKEEASTEAKPKGATTGKKPVKKEHTHAP